MSVNEWVGEMSKKKICAAKKMLTRVLRLCKQKE